MPISERIIKEINALSVNNERKALLIKILEAEDNGKRYKAEYEKIIKKYIIENFEDKT